MKNKKMRRAWAFILSFSLAATIQPYNLYAEERETNSSVFAVLEGTEKHIASGVMDNTDNDELFAGYVADVFELTSDTFYSGSFSGNKLTGKDKVIYNCLKEQITKVADGELESAVLKVPITSAILPKLEYTKAELGVSDILQKNGSGYTITNEAKEAIYAKLDYSAQKIINALLMDCPYELYWYDKTAGANYINPGITASLEKIQFVKNPDDISDKGAPEITFSLTVDKKYRKSSSSDKYSVDTDATGAAKNAAAYAKEIVEDVQYQTDYNKLKYYREKICELTEYNNDAASSGISLDGISPWQIIYVFDRNDSTNVVCEGYSKAFQYLCELTTFDSDEIYSKIVTGTMNSGNHMWNVIHMDDGKNYLVDVTNCDTGTVGADDKLFIKNADSTIASSGDTIAITVNSGSTLNYVYDSDTCAAYSYEELVLSETEYQIPDLKTFDTKPQAVNGCAGRTLTQEMLAGYTGWEWSAASTGTVVPGVVGEKINAKAVYNGQDKNKYKPEELETTVEITSVNHRFISSSGVSSTINESCSLCGIKNINYSGMSVENIELTYTGNNQKPVPVFKDKSGNIISSENYDIQVEEQVDAGTSYTMTVNGKNDYAGTRNVTWKINKANPEVGIVSYDENANGKLYDTTPASSVVLTRANTSIDGTLVLSDSSLSSKKTSYGWKFTPRDTRNYNTETGTVALTVTKNVLTELKLDGELAKKEYTYGDVFDITGLKVLAKYLDGSSEDVTSKVNFGSLLAGQKTETISYTKDGITKSVYVNITVNKAVPEYVVPTGMTAICGDELSSVVLPSGFSWEDSSTYVFEGGGIEKGQTITKKVTFTPQDTLNYKVIKGIDVSVEVKHNISVISNGNDTHSSKCSKCSFKGREIKCSGGIATCVKKAICEACGTEYGNIKADNHESELEEHKANPATCIKTGTIAYWSCATCQKNFTDAAGKNEAATIFENINPNNHENPKLINAVKETCKENGYTGDVYCDRCNVEVVKGSIIEKSNAHTPKSPVREKITASSCVENGSCEEVIYCEICDKELARTPKTLFATGHSLKRFEKKEPTCTAKGKKEYWQCSECRCKFLDKNGMVAVTDESVLEIAKLEHTPKAIVEKTKKATCTVEGYNVEVTSCSGCGLELSREKKVIQPTGHNYNKGETLKQATCSSTGVTLYTCTECHVTKTNIIKKNPDKHSGSTVLKNKKAATYGAKGYTGDVCCKKCGKKLASGKSIAKLVVKNVKITSITNPKTKKLVIKWTTNKNATGYVLQYSTSNAFTSKSTVSVVLKSKNTSTRTVKNLKKGTRYYIRIRTYKTENGKKYYSGRSGIKNKKIVN